MEGTLSDKEDVLMKLSKTSKIINTIHIVALITFVLSNLIKDAKLQYIIEYGSLIVLVINIIASFILLRCPKCRKMISSGLVLEAYCPRCGQKIE